MCPNTSYNKPINLKLIGFNDQDKSKFDSIFTLAESRLKASWKITTIIEETDFFLLSYRLKNQVNTSALLNNLPKNQRILCARKLTEGKEHELLTSGDGLPSLRSLIILFNELSAKFIAPLSQENTKIKQDVSSQVKTAPPPFIAPIFLSKKDSNTLGSRNYFDPTHGFIGLLLSQQTTDTISYFNLDIEGVPTTLYIDFKKKHYYSSAELTELHPFFSEDTPSSKKITEIELDSQLASTQLKAKTLTHLIWYATFICSQGRVRKDHSETDIVHLKRWPDINLPGCRPLIKLAAYMQSNATQLSVTQKKTGFPMSQIYNFYNACHAIGLIVQTKTTDIHNKKLDNEKREVFSKIIQCLGKVK